MATAKAVYTRVLADGYQISSQTNKVTVKLDAKKTDVTPFEATAQAFIVLDPEPSIDIAGYIHNSTNPDTYEAIAHGALNTATTIGVIKAASTTFAGQPGYVLPNATTVNMSQDYPVDGVMTISATWGGATAMRRGLCVFAGSITSTAAQTAIDFGAAGTTGGYAYLFVTGITGAATNATFVVESATTQGGSYSTEGTFTLSAIGAYAVDLSGNIDRWLRIKCTSLGGATGFAVNCIVCVKGVTQ